MEAPAITIAFADDHALFRETLVTSITAIHPNFHFVIQANNGNELLKKLSTIDVIPNICILDVYLPELTGYSTVAELRKRWPEVKILVLSTCTHEYAIVNMLRSGACGYLLKTTSIHEVGAAIETVFAKGYVRCDLIDNYPAKEALYAPLKGTEAEFLKYCCEELSYQEIAKKMNVSIRTVQGYRDKLFDKLNIKSRTGLAMFAIQTGLAPNHPSFNWTH